MKGQFNIAKEICYKKLHVLCISNYTLFTMFFCNSTVNISQTKHAQDIQASFPPPVAKKALSLKTVSWSTASQ